MEENLLPREYFSPSGDTPGELVGLPNTEVLGPRWTRLHTVDAKLLPHSPTGVTGRAMGSVHKQTSLFSTGISTTDVLEAIAEKNEN